MLKALLRADRAISGDDGGPGEHQETIRSCFIWREISLAPDAVLLRPHSLDQCGIAARAGLLGQADDEAVRRMIVTLEDELKGRARDRRPAAPA